MSDTPYFTVRVVDGYFMCDRVPTENTKTRVFLNARALGVYLGQQLGAKRVRKKRDTSASGQSEGQSKPVPTVEQSS